MKYKLSKSDWIRIGQQAGWTKTASSLNRIWHFVQEDNRDFGVISSFRNQYTLKDNMQRHNELKKKVREMGLGYIELEGGYEGDEVADGELSLLVPNITREQAIDLGVHYGQHSVMYKDNKDFAYIGTNTTSGIGKTLQSFIKGGGRDNMSLTKEKFWSRLLKGRDRKTKFLFKEKPDPLGELIEKVKDKNPEDDTEKTPNVIL